MEQSRTIQERVASYCAEVLIGHDDEVIFAKLEYGLSILILNITKMVFVFVVASCIGAFRLSLLTFLIFSTLRINVFGRHANNSIVCTIETCLLFVLLPWIVSQIVNNLFLNVVMLTCILAIIRYAPLYTVLTPKKAKAESRLHKKKQL